MKKHFSKSENAEVMVEASLILSVAVIIVFMLFYLGFIMYHQTLITSVANQAATNIAQVYGNQYKDPVTGYVDVSSLDKEGIVNKMKNQDYAAAIVKKAEWFSKYKMAKGQILNADEPVVKVRIENKRGALLRAQVVVEIDADYDLPFVHFFGINNSTLHYHAMGRADCYEIMDYVNIIEAADKIDVTENFTVTFHNKGSVHKVVEVMHDMSIAETAKLSAADKTRFPANPTYSGERFYRWKTANGATFTDQTVVTGNIDVYAEYDCRVIFTRYDGKTQYAMKYAHRGQPFRNGGEVLPTGLPQEGENKFYCWWYNNAPFTDSTVVPDADTITVTVKKYYWVKFNANGGTTGETIRYVAPGSAVGNLPNLSRTHYVFDGWFTSKDGGTQYNASTRINANVTLYAHWRPYYCVTFDANGGTVSERERWIAPGAAVGNLPGSSRAGYAFDGWFTDRNGGTQYGASSRINGNITLFAHWHCTHPSTRRQWVANDCTREEYNDYCAVCGAHLGHYYHVGDHDWEYCNVTHNIGQYRISTHAGSTYQYSTKGRCIVCAKCHARRNGYWCTQHVAGGRYYTDNWWRSNGYEVKYH